MNGLGDGFWGAGRGAGQQMFDTWLSPGNLYLAGYGSTAVNPNPYQCVVGQQQSTLLPLSTCDPNQLMQVEFIGPNSPNPNKTAWPRDKNNFGPAVGFSWQLPWFGEGKTTVRGGYQITYGTTTRDGVAVDTLLGSAPNSVLTPTTVNTDADVAAILATRALNLTDIPALTPVRPTSAPGRVIPIYSRSLGFTQYDPNFEEPYVQNLNLSVTRAVSRNISVDVRYVGTLSRKQLGNVDLNTNNVYHNPELMEALTATRAGQDHPLFDQMLAGLNINGAACGRGLRGRRHHRQRTSATRFRPSAPEYDVLPESGERQFRRRRELVDWSRSYRSAGQAGGTDRPRDRRGRFRCLADCAPQRLRPHRQRLVQPRIAGFGVQHSDALLPGRLLYRQSAAYQRHLQRQHSRQQLPLAANPVHAAADEGDQLPGHMGVDQIARFGLQYVVRSARSRRQLSTGKSPEATRCGSTAASSCPSAPTSF